MTELGAEGLWAEASGDGAPTLVLLHGLHATAEVWRGLYDLLADRWPGRRMLVDLRGHGRSSHAPLYSFGAHAVDVAGVEADGQPLVVVGHSMGGVIGVLLASGWFGVRVTAAFALGVKVSWTDDERSRAHASRDRPVAGFETREEAVSRFLRLAGLAGLVEPGSRLAVSGTVEEERGHRVAADPAVPSVGAPDFGRLLAAAQAPVYLACGEHDSLVSVAQLRSLDSDAVALAGRGHNVHVEDPAAVWEWIATKAAVASLALRRD